MCGRPISCVVADDHPAVLRSVVGVLEEAGVTVVGCAANGEDALREIERKRPQVALLDLALPHADGIEIARSAARSSPETAVIIYTGYGGVAQVTEALDVGVRGIVLKGAPLAELLRATELVASGGTYVDPVVGGQLTRANAPADRPELTRREREVLRLLSQGRSNEEIAARLLISAETVKTHVSNAKRKLGSATRTEAVATALRRSLIS